MHGSEAIIQQEPKPNLYNGHVGSKSLYGRPDSQSHWILKLQTLPVKYIGRVQVNFRPKSTRLWVWILGYRA